MLVKKIFNNNVLLAEDGNQEIVVIGRGVGFQQKIGQVVAQQKIEKCYYPKDQRWTTLFNELTSAIAFEYIEIASHIIATAEARLDTDFDDYLLIGLADHIQFAVARQLKALPIKNELLWETKHFYPEEYMIGEEAVAYIAAQLNVTLADDEVGFIALKFIEKRAGPEISERATSLTNLIEGVLTIVRHELSPKIDYSALNYQRLVVHLRFLLDRLLSDEYENNADNPFDQVMMQHFEQRYTKAYRCAEDIIRYIEHETHRGAQTSERIYLTMHLQRLLEHMN